MSLSRHSAASDGPRALARRRPGRCEAASGLSAITSPVSISMTLKRGRIKIHTLSSALTMKYFL